MNNFAAVWLLKCSVIILMIFVLPYIDSLRFLNCESLMLGVTNTIQKIPKKSSIHIDKKLPKM